jgi:LPXTG-motif cell wall-anchored protein
MKRLVLAIFTLFALAAAGTLLAQNPLNTTAPGATQQQPPGLTNNDLPNPGNPQTQQNTGTTGTTTGTMGTTGTTATGTTGTTETTTNTNGGAGTSGSSYDTSTTSTNTNMDTTTGSATGSAASGGSLPHTASDLPLVAAIGLLALGASFLIRSRRRSA